MTRPTILDVFCGEGGASAGYERAGFEVVGVDNAPARLARYPFERRLDDWAAGIDYWMSRVRVSAIHASPPCTGYTRGTAAIPDRLDRYDRLIPLVREFLVETGLPFVIENVADARHELRSPVMLCGRMFNLETTDNDGTELVLDRHRLFECHGFDPQPIEHDPHDRTRQVAGAYAGARRDKVEARTVRRGGYVPPDVEVQRRLLDAPPWMSERGIQLSIPPAYTEYLGLELLASLA